MMLGYDLRLLSGIKRYDHQQQDDREHIEDHEWHIVQGYCIQEPEYRIGQECHSKFYLKASDPPSVFLVPFT